jgi:hypothetical protein
MAGRQPVSDHPSDVAALTVAEFMRALQTGCAGVVSVRSMPFAGAFSTMRTGHWSGLFDSVRVGGVVRTHDSTLWLHSDPSHKQDACELAASFDLNDDWGFDAERFRSAV